MLISRRRLRWGALGLLLVCILILLRPTRTWLEGVWIAHALGPQVTIQDLIVHPSKSIVQANQIRWREELTHDGSSLPHQTLGVHIDRSWIGVERRSLPTGQIRFPKVILEDANLSLDSDLPSSNIQRTAWQQRIAQVIEALDWTSALQELSYQQATEKTQLSWQRQLASWQKRSSHLLDQANQLQAEVHSLNNPLRAEQSLRDRLMRMQQVAAHHDALALEIDQFPKTLTTDTARLRQDYLQDIDKLTTRLAQEINTESSVRQRTLIATDCLLEIGQLAWRQLAPYGQIVDRIGAVFDPSQTTPHDVTIRAPEYAGKWFQVDDWKASGTFRSGALRANFHATGGLSAAQLPTSSPCSLMNLDAVFDDAASQVSANARFDLNGQHQIELVLSLPIQMADSNQESVPDILADESPSDHIIQPPSTLVVTSAEDSLNGVSPASQLQLVTQMGTLAGTLSIQPPALAKFAKQLPDDLTPFLPQLLTDTTSDSLDLAIHGTWSQVELELLHALPRSVADQIERELQTQLQQAVAAKVIQLESEFDRQLLALRFMIESTSTDLKQQIDMNSQQLLASQQSLQQRVDEIQGTEFARRPDAIQR